VDIVYKALEQILLGKQVIAAKTAKEVTERVMHRLSRLLIGCPAVMERKLKNTLKKCSMNKPFALIVDFDNTLIDSSKYKQNLFLLAKDFGLSLKNANQAYIAVTKTKPFTVKRFSKMLFKKEIKTQKQFQLKAELIFTKPKQYNY
jgi:hypothetical protein